MAPKLVSKNYFAALAMDGDSDNESTGSQSPPQSGSPVLMPQNSTLSAPSSMPLLSRTKSESFDWADDVEEELAADQEFRRRQSGDAGVQQQPVVVEEKTDGHVIDEETDEPEHTEDVQNHTSEAPKVEEVDTENQSLDVVVVEEAPEEAEAPQAEDLSPLQTIQEEDEATAEVSNTETINTISTQASTPVPTDTEAELMVAKQAPATEVTTAPVSTKSEDLQDDATVPHILDDTTDAAAQVAEEQQQTSSSSSSGEEHDTGATSPAPESISSSPREQALNDEDLSQDTEDCMPFSREDLIRIDQMSPEAEAGNWHEGETSQVDKEDLAAPGLEEKAEALKVVNAVKEEDQAESNDELDANLEEHWLSRKSSQEQVQESTSSQPVDEPPSKPVPEVPAAAANEEEEAFRAPPGYAVPPIAYAAAAKKSPDAAPEVPEVAEDEVAELRLTPAVIMQPFDVGKKDDVVNLTKQALGTLQNQPADEQEKKKTCRGRKSKADRVVVSAPGLEFLSSASSTAGSAAEPACPKRVVIKTTQDADGWTIPGSRHVVRSSAVKSAAAAFSIVASTNDDDDGEDVVAPIPGDEVVPSTKSVAISKNVKAISKEDNDALNGTASATIEAPKPKKKGRTHAQRKAARRATQAMQAAAVEDKATQSDVEEVLAKQEHLEQVLPDHLECLPRRKRGYLGAVKVMATGSAILTWTCAVIVALVKSS